MDLKQLITHFAYKIEPRPEGGFVARATDPSVPPIEGATREELQQKIQRNILDALSTEFPALKSPSGGFHREMSFHIEHQPGGGYSIHSADPNTPTVDAANSDDLENKFLEKFLGFVGKHLAPDFCQALAAQVGSANVKVVVNGRTSLRVSSSPAGLTFGAKDSPPAQSPSTLTPELSDSTRDFAPTGTITDAPIAPESGNAWKVLAILVAVLLIGGLLYFGLHR